MTSASERGRPRRRCDRCGRAGYNAFAPIPDRRPTAYRCTHEKQCRARQQSDWRARSRGGRPRSSPLTTPLEAAAQACVIGIDREATTSLAELLTECTDLWVESLEFNPRAMSRLSRGTYRLVILDTTEGDPLAYRNELARRLSGPARRHLPLVICHTPGDELRPPIATLAARDGARLLARPFDVPTLLRTVESVLLARSEPKLPA